MSKNSVENKLRNKWASSMARFDNVIKYNLLQEVFEHEGKFSSELFFILDLEFIPFLDEENKKFKLTYLSGLENPKERDSFNMFMEKLENYKKDSNNNKKEKEFFENLLCQFKILFDKKILKFM